VGVNDPLHIVHQPLEDRVWQDQHGIAVSAKHRSGVADLQVFYRVSGEEAFVELELTDAGDSWWTGFLPAFEVGTVIEYYVEANANSGKSLTRPLPAPAGYWSFEIIEDEMVGIEGVDVFALPVFPNPSNGFTVIPVTSSEYVQGSIDLLSINGQLVKNIFEGTLEAREKNYFFDVSDLAPGAYLVRTQYPTHNEVQKLMVK